MPHITNSRAAAVAEWRKAGGYLLYLGTGSYAVVGESEIAEHREPDQIAELNRNNRNEIDVDDSE